VSRRDRDKERLPLFVPLLKDTLASPAWKAMSHGAKVLYIALKAKYFHKQHNNGRLFLSQRDAAAEIGSSTEEIRRWYRELVHYGFIVMTSPGCLGVEGRGKAPHWRLTELGYMHDPPTKDFIKWDGIRFQHRARTSRKTRSRVAYATQGVAEMLHTSVAEMLPTQTANCSGNATHTGGQHRGGNATHN
jgi:hypothetical protein